MDTPNKRPWMLVAIAIIFGMTLAWLITDLKAEEVPVPRLQGRVTDLASALSPDQKSKLEAQLKDLEQFPNKPQVAVLILNTTGDDGIDAFKTKVFNTWKLGNAETNNGLLTVLAVKDRKVGTEVGYGNEPYFTDGRMAKIRVETMTPFLKKGEWYNALSAETAEFKKVFAANPEEQIARPVDTQKAVNSATPHKSGHGFLLFILFLLIVIGGIVWFLKRQRKSSYSGSGFGTSRGTRYTPDYDTDNYTSPSFPPSYGSRRYDTPSAATQHDHTIRDSAIGGFAGGVAGSVVGNAVNRRRDRDDDDSYFPSRSSSTVSDSGGSSGSTSWGSSSDSGSSGSSSSSDSGSSYSGDGGSSGGGGDSGGF